MAISPLCPLCGVEEEMIAHCIRDCLQIQPLWKSLIRLDKHARFFQLQGGEWLVDQLKQKTGEIPWCTTFVVAANNVWQNRNNVIFNQGITDVVSMVSEIRIRTQEIALVTKASRQVQGGVNSSSVMGHKSLNTLIS